MAKITITYDTIEKKLVASMDGKNLENIAQIGVYNYNNDEAHIEITSVLANEEEGLYERRCLYASHEETSKVVPKINMNSLSDKISKELGILK